MSTKTLRKRIALVAVSALGAGLLSVVPANAADPSTDATISTLAVKSYFDSGDGSGTTVALDPSFSASKYAYSGYMLSTDGYVTVKPNIDNAATMTVNGTALTDDAESDLFSVGIGSKRTITIVVTAEDTTTTKTYVLNVYRGSFSVDTTGSNACVIKKDSVAQTVDFTATSANSVSATISVGGTVAFNDNGTPNGWEFATISSGSVSTTDGDLKAAKNYYLIDDGGSFTVTGTSAGSSTVKFWDANPFTSASANLLAEASVTVVATCANDSFSATKSALQVAGDVVEAPVYGKDVLTYAAGSDAYISIDAKSGYSTTLEGTWAASATNGALVAVSDSAAINGLYSAGTTSSASKTSTSSPIYVRVTPKTPATASTTTVTVTYNGATVATRTITFYGEATKINLVANTIGLTGGQGMIWYQFADAAGNKVPGSASVDATTLNATVSGLTQADAALLTPAVPTAVVNSSNVSDLLPKTNYGIAVFTCGANSGSATVTLQSYSAVNANLLTLPVTLNCAGGLNTYTISTDKASYKVGEIATITITGKDASGAAVSDFAPLGAGATVSAGGGLMVKAATSADTFSGGVKTYQAQMTTAGAFNAVAVISGATTKSATASYTVTSGEVSNTEVLAAIVKLIASINKQISALQKLLKKK